MLSSSPLCRDDGKILDVARIDTLLLISLMVTSGSGFRLRQNGSRNDILAMGALDDFNDKVSSYILCIKCGIFYNTLLSKTFANKLISLADVCLVQLAPYIRGICDKSAF